MYKFIFFCCLNIISSIDATPIDSDPKIYQILQLDFLNKCPSILNNKIDILQSNGGLSHCKNVSIGDPPQKIELPNLNDFYCVGLLAADIEFCSGNKQNKLLKNYDDLKSNIDKIIIETPEKICDELKQLTLFNETKNVKNLKKWIDILDQNLHDENCVGLCSDNDKGHTNLFCSMMYYINNKISYAIVTEKTATFLTKIEHVALTTIKNNAQPKPAATPAPTSAPLNINVDKHNIAKVNTTGASTISNAQIKNNTLKPVVTHVDAVNQQPVAKKTESQNPAPVAVKQISTTEAAVVENKIEAVEPVKTTQMTEEPKLPPPVNENPSVEEIPKIPSNVESSSVSSTVSGVRDELNEDYLDEMDEINKENEDQLLPQTNARKETVEILTSDQDRYRMPTEEGEDMEESNFFSYFMFVSVMFIAGYVVYHNKQKIMALLLEGRRDRNSRRRPNTASYRKLNSNLEEAVTSKCSGSASHVIY